MSANAGLADALYGGRQPVGPPSERFAGKNDEAKAMLVACYLNGSMCALKAEAWREAELRQEEAVQASRRSRCRPSLPLSPTTLVVAHACASVREGVCTCSAW